MSKELYLKILEIYFLILNILSLILTIILYSKTNDLNFNYLSSLSNNWQRGPIISIFTTYEKICPNNSSFITDLYPGTFKSCDTSTGLKVLGTGCPKRSKTIYDPIDQIHYYKWRNTTICSDRLLSNYLSLSIENNKNECPKGERYCGIIDTEHNFLCLPNDKVCPFNYIEFNLTEPSQIQNISTVKLNNMYLTLSNNYKSNKILNEFIINEEIPCLDTRYKSYKAPIFPIEIYAQYTICKNSLTNSTNDPNVELKDSYDFYSIYEENGINSKLINISTYSNYSSNLKSSKRTLSFYSKSYIGIEADCLKLIKEKNLSQIILNDLKNFDKKMTDSGSFVIYALIIGGIDTAFCILISFMLWYPKFCCSELRVNKEDITIKTSLQLSFIILNFSFLIVSALLTSNSFGVETNFRILFENNCMKDEFTNLFFVNAYNMLNLSKGLGICILITSGLTLLGFITYIIILFCCCKDEEIHKKNESNKEKELSDKI